MRQAEVTYVCTYVQACTCSTYFFIIFKTRIKDILPYSALVRWGMVPEGLFTVWRSGRGFGWLYRRVPKNGSKTQTIHKRGGSADYCYHVHPTCHIYEHSARKYFNKTITQNIKIAHTLLYSVRVHRARHILRIYCTEECSPSMKIMTFCLLKIRYFIVQCTI